MATHLKREINWRGSEFLYKKKTPLWYTNVGVFFFLVMLALLFSHNVFGVAVLAFALWLFLGQANHRPRTVDYTIDQLGLHIEDRLIPFETLEAFAVETLGANAVVVFDPVDAFAFPVTIVTKTANLDTLVDILLQHLPQQPRMPLLTRITHRLHY